MKKLSFICHGNICRMSSSIYYGRFGKEKWGKLYVSSAATSCEEIGNDIYPPAKP